MWSHYAENHKGFCIEYNFNKLKVNSRVKKNLYPVFYSEKLANMVNLIPEHSSRKIKFSFAKILLPYIQKGIEWKYELEWRALFRPAKGKLVKMPKPTAIYLGSKITRRNENILKAIAKERNLPIFKMKLSLTEFKMDAEPLWKPK